MSFLICSKASSCCLDHTKIAFLVVSLRIGCTTSDSRGRNLARQLTNPSRLSISCLQVGLGILLTASILLGSGLRPSVESTWPRYFTSGLRRLSFLLLNFKLTLRVLCKRSSRFASWSALASSMVSPVPVTNMWSSRRTSTPSKSPRSSCS